jgi:capsular exopolysaccharide synthesis family protein
MDHFSKALEHAEREGHRVRKWVQPSPVHSELRIQHVGDAVVGHRISLDLKHLSNRHILSGDETENAVIADKYRLLRTQLLQRMRVNNWSRLAITSPGPKAGKTMTSLNLAISIARDGNQRVVLIDADLRKPSIASELGLEVEFGLIDYLAGEVGADEVALISEEIPNLTIVPGRCIVGDEVRTELLGSSRALALLEEISRSGEPTIVLVDMPPVFVGDDVILLAEHLDCVLLIIEEGATEIEEMTTAADLLRQFNLIGTVLNKSTEKQKDLSGYYHTASGKQ